VTKTCVKTDKAPAPVGPYNQAVVVGDLVFTAGQIALDVESGEMVGDDVTQQAMKALDNLKAVLEAAGSGLDRAVKATVFLRHMGDFKAVNEVYGQYFDVDPPARSVVEVGGLPLGALVEIECIASL
jgi:2-iminobutanoate/2-iminopropanoate deaminase